jgi:RNase adapter protein RapZ
LNLTLDHISHLVLVAGISGAGKSSAIHMLSDLGFYIVDNLPVPLLPFFLEFSKSSSSRFQKIAVHVDIDSSKKLSQFLELLRLIDPERHIPALGPRGKAQRPRDEDGEDDPLATSPSLRKIVLVFLDCKTETIVKRYSETRRPHPGFDAQRDNTLIDAIERERGRLMAFKEVSDFIIDTTVLSPHDLRRELKSFTETLTASPARQVRVNFLSFGFKYGVPIDCDLVVDVRFLPNPYFEPELRERTGLEEDVRSYVLESPDARGFVERYLELLNYLIPRYIFEGKSYLNIGIGCTGGKHRSVAIAQHLADALTKASATKDSYEDEFLVSVKHRDISK